MSLEHSSDVKFEVGHVLYIDIVRYSTLLINQQSEQLETLRKIVRGTEQFGVAQAEGKLLRLPTGDGGALVFRNSPEAPVLCALEIARALKGHPAVRVRMGIHSGPVNEITDLNEQANIAGAGINIAQRVMDCGDAGHILLSRHVAEDLEHYPRWQPYLHPLGDCEVKHGQVISVVNFYQDELGNPAVPEKLRRSVVEAAVKKSPIDRNRLVIAALIIAALAIGSFVFWRLQKPTTSASALTIPQKSIAVLPLENLSGDPNNAYFTEGIQEEILTRLAKVADLKVISRTSTQQFRSKPANLSEIGRQLGVANILEGSVQRSADQVRVNVQLIAAATDAHLWADTFDRKLTDIFAVESDIAKTVAETLQAKLTGSEKTAIAKRPTENPEAHELYLKGRFYWNRRTGENLKKALEQFQQAVDKDPTFALAYVGLADCYLQLEEYASTPSSEAQPKARAATLRALQLDDSLGEAHTSFGLVNQYLWQFGEAEKEYKRGIELSPNYPTAHHWYSVYLLTQAGQIDEAMAESKRAQELDPLSPVISDQLTACYFLKGDLNAGIEQCRKNIELNPNYPRAHGHLGWAYLKQGREREAMAELQKAVEVSGRGSQELSFLGNGYGALGKRTEAMAILKELEERYTRRESLALYIAAVHAGLGDKDQAFAWLERDFQARTGMLSVIVFRPQYDTLRDDPRYTDLLRRMGLRP